MANRFGDDLSAFFLNSKRDLGNLFIYEKKTTRLFLEKLTTTSSLGTKCMYTFVLMKTELQNCGFHCT